MNKTLNKVLTIIIPAFIVIFPSYFSTMFANVFDFAKITLMAMVVILVLVILALKLISEGKLSIASSKIDIPLLLLVISYLASTFTRTPNRMEAFLVPGNASIIVLAFFIYLFTKIAFKGKKITVALSLLFSGVLVSVISMFSFLGLFESIPQLPDLMKRADFSALGGKLPEVIFLAIIVPIAVALTLDAKDKTKKLLFGVSTLIIVFSMILSITLILPGKPASPIIVSHQASWEVAVDTLKLSPVFGIGPGNYLSAFSSFLPISYNSTPLWANRFLSGSSYVLTLTTEVGLFGLGAFILSLYLLIKRPLKSIEKLFSDSRKVSAGYFVSLVLITLSFFTLPASHGLIILFFFIAYLNSETDETVLNLSATRLKNGNVFVSRMPSTFLAAVILGLAITLGMFSGKLLMAERSYKMAIDAIIQNDAKAAYDSLRTAINKNGYVDRYHATLAQLTLALARSLSQKSDIKDEDRSAISQLIQQSIAEAKATVALNRGRSANWETLGRTYQSIMPFAQGADNFTIVSFNQAIALDPINPNLRIALGGVYYALGRYDDAINAFGMAVAAKPDLANAHYNLAVAYREKKELEKALAEMNTVLTLVKEGTPDHDLAVKTIEEMKKTGTGSPEDPTQATDNLTPPVAEDPALEPKLELPQDSTPPASQ